jgi:hypothetical protein
MTISRRLAWMLAFALGLAGCGAAPAVDPDPTPQRTERPEPTPPQGALAQMALVFEGGYSQEEIKARVDRSLADFGLEPTEANYRRVGDVLVALANHNVEEAGCPSCTEMAILDYMLATGPLEGMEWHEAAAWASSFLVAEGGP